MLGVWWSMGRSVGMQRGLQGLPHESCSASSAFCRSSSRRQATSVHSRQPLHTCTPPHYRPSPHINAAWLGAPGGAPPSQTAPSRPAAAWPRQSSGSQDRARPPPPRAALLSRSSWAPLWNSRGHPAPQFAAPSASFRESAARRQAVGGGEVKPCMGMHSNRLGLNENSAATTAEPAVHHRMTGQPSGLC